MKLSQVESLKSTLSIISQKELSFRLAYKISKLTERLEKDSEFFNEKFQSLIQKYALRDENGEIIVEDGNVKIIPDQILEAEKALGELNDVETEECNIFFTLDEFEGLEIKPSELTGLLPFIKEE